MMAHSARIRLFSPHARRGARCERAVSLLQGRCELDDNGVLTARGPHARSFLQGQLSQDVTRLAAGRPQLAGYHTPQGRVIAVLRLLPAAGEGVHCILPRELVAPLAAMLRKFILRAKVTLTDDSEALRVVGIAGDAQRTLALEPAGAAPGATDIPRAAWHALDIAAGLPQVYAATSGEFVAQMLNLDCVDGIAFDKGCYTGQEIIARAHYRGRVKRRMQRFVTRGAPDTALAPGVAGVLADGRACQIVDAAPLADGRVEFLAVAPLAVPPRDAAEVTGSTTAQQPAAVLDAEALPLPYALPD